MRRYAERIAVSKRSAVTASTNCRRDMPHRRQFVLAVTALLFDTAILSAYLLIYNFDSGSPIRQVLYLAVTEAAVRFGIVCPLLLTVATIPVLVEFERLRSMRGDDTFRTDFVTFQAGSQVFVGLIVGCSSSASATSGR